MSASNYRIVDEPAPGLLSRFVVDPFWPLLATMMASSLLGYAWLIFNSFALGSPTRGREIAYCVGGVIGAVAVLVGGGMAFENGWITEAQVRYLALPVIACKLLAAYLVCFSQQRALELFEYFGGEKQNGIAGLIVSIMLVRVVLGPVLAKSSWALLLI
jgi:hypothetical protein